VITHPLKTYAAYPPLTRGRVGGFNGGISIPFNFSNFKLRSLLVIPNSFDIAVAKRNFTSDRLKNEKTSTFLLRSFVVWGGIEPYAQFYEKKLQTKSDETLSMV